MKIALVCSDDFSLWVFRRCLISNLIQRGHSVYLICSSGEYIRLLKQIGVCHIPLEFHRFLNVHKDVRSFISLYSIFRKERFDVMHAFTIKPNIYGGIAARLAGIRRIILSVTGLGILREDEFSGEFRVAALRAIAKWLYRLACVSSKKVWFQNEEDINYFKSQGMLRSNKEVLIKSSGVNLEEYSVEAVDQAVVDKLKRELNFNDLTKNVAMVSRPLWNKGVIEFIEASEILSKKYKFVKFVLVGGVEEGNPLSIPPKFIKERESNHFKWLGFRNEIREIQSIADVSVLPSYYPEGVPRNLLEAMSLGNPIVTTNTVGCREVVEEGKNGFLVPVRDSNALAKAIEILLLDDNKRRAFGQYSRIKAEKEFDEKNITERMISELYEI